MRMKNLFWGGIVLLSALAGCGQNESPTRPNDFTPLTSIVIFAPYSTIAPKTSTPLSAIGNFSGLFTRDISAQVVWVSSAPTIAGFITPPNRVIGINPGTATLTATMGDVTASYNLRVTAATIATLAISPVSPPQLPSGLNSQFAVSGTFSDATIQDLTFDAHWASSNTAAATVSNDVGSKGLAHGVAIGSTKISATFDNMSSSAQLTVTAAALQSIVVTPANPSFLTVSNGSFAATGHYSDGTTLDITSQVSWTSSAPANATIAADGTATNLKQGTTSIGATLAGVSGATTLKVTGGDLISIALTPANPTLVNDTSMPVTATGTFSNGTSRDITGKVTWSVTDTVFATVDAPGGNLAWLNALAVTPALPQTKLSAKSGTVTGETNLKVTAPTLKSNGLTITPISQSLPVGTSGRFKVTGAFSDGMTQDLTATADWTSSDGATAAVGNIGLAKGLVIGKAANLASVTISAGYGSQTITAAVTVTQPTLKGSPLGLTISPSSANFSSGTQLKFTATASYTDNSSHDITEDVTWTIDKSNVAILADGLNQPGLVVAVDSGTATLTASFGGQTQTATLTVP
jgi:hypothetical protein